MGGATKQHISEKDEDPGWWEGGRVGGGEVKGALLQTVGVSELKRVHVLEESAQQRGGIHHPLHRLSRLCFQNRGEKKSQGQDLLLHSQQIESNSADAGGNFRHIKKTRRKKKESRRKKLLLLPESPTKGGEKQQEIVQRCPRSRKVDAEGRQIA